MSMTPMERARRFLDNQPYPPAGYPETDPVRIIYELVRGRDGTKPDPIEVQKLSGKVNEHDKVNEHEMFRDEIRKSLKLGYTATKLEILAALAKLQS